MLWSNFHYVIFGCLMLVIECRLKFKTKACEKSRDVTILFDSLIIKYDRNEYATAFFYYRHTFNHLEEMMKRIKAIACLRVSFVLVRDKTFWKELKFLNMFYDSFRSLKNTNPHNVLKETLQLYEIQTRNPRTLVLLTGQPLRNDIVEILYRLQATKNIIVILVSYYTDIFKLKQIPRHRKFIYGHRYGDSFVDVIKNPNFNRFEFNNHLPNIKEDRSCLKKLTIVLVISTNHFSRFPEDYGVTVTSLNNYNHEITVHKVCLLYTSPSPRDS